MPQLRISHFRQDRNFKLKVKAQIVEKIKILKYETWANVFLCVRFLRTSIQQPCQRFVYLLFLVISESSIYHTIIAEKLQIPKKMRNGMQTSRKMKLVLLSFHDRFLNLSENIGISDTSSHEKRQTSSNR